MTLSPRNCVLKEPTTSALSICDPKTFQDTADLLTMQNQSPQREAHKDARDLAV